ncbi:MAG: hypothetical protein WCO82_07045 [Sphingomonadales bacterium]|jgi:hypothetical protein
MARALLRLWALAELAMTLLYAGQLQALWGLPGAVPAPPVPRQVPVLEGLYLFIFLPAALVVALRWWQQRDSWLAGLALAYSAASLASFALWAGADSLGAVRGLYGLDAALSLAGMVVAFRALRV